MFPSYVLSLREGLEAALIIGIILGALRKMNRPLLSPLVWYGVAIASGVSLMAALVLYNLGAAFEGAAEQVFEGITMILAAGVLTWMIFWMQSQAKNIKNNLEADVRKAVHGPGRWALFSLAFLAVVREGIELALFLTAASFATQRSETLIGASLGLGTAILLGWSLFAATVRLDLGRFFKVTGVLLILFAAGLVAHGVHEFNEVGWIPALIDPVWDINFVLNEKSLLGEMLKALLGYNGDPSLTEVLSYLAYFGAILFGLRRRQAAMQPVAQEISP